MKFVWTFDDVISAMWEQEISLFDKLRADGENGFEFCRCEK